MAQPDMTHVIADLSQVQLTVRVHFGWRAIIASWLIRLGAWVGGSQVEFLGGGGGTT